MGFKCYIFIVFLISVMIFHISCGGGNGDVNNANSPPTVTIISPSNISTFTEGQKITFTGTGTDTEDGVLTEDALVWVSDKDGQIGTGESFSLSNLSINIHIITLTVTDKQGHQNISQVTISVTAKEDIQFGQSIFDLANFE